MLNKCNSPNSGVFLKYRLHLLCWSPHRLQLPAVKQKVVSVDYELHRWVKLKHAFTLSMLQRFQMGTANGESEAGAMCLLVSPAAPDSWLSKLCRHSISNFSDRPFHAPIIWFGISYDRKGMEEDIHGKLLIYSILTYF